MTLFRRLLDRKNQFSPPRVAAGLRVYVIGDIHGCINLLEKTLSMIELDMRSARADEYRIVFLGDYVDRGLASNQVLDRLSSGLVPAPCVFLRGNHEAMVLDFLAETGAEKEWWLSGGLEMLHSYGIDTPERRSSPDFVSIRQQFRQQLPRRHIEFLERTELSWWSGDYFFCHAGVRPGFSLQSQTAADLLWIREPFLSSAISFGKVVVHGHTPVAEPEFRPNRINIDTGAYITGQLACLVLQEDRRHILSTPQGIK